MSTGIEWTDETWNPTRGCSRISPGCKNCYAERQAIRQRNAGYKGLVTITNGHPAWTGVVRESPERTLYAPMRWRRPRRVFVDSMSDLWHEDLPGDVIARAYAIMAYCHQHTFQILTKRSDKRLRYAGLERDVGDCLVNSLIPTWGMPRHSPPFRWPLRNVWEGVSVESPAYLHRVQELIETPAAVRFISYEPALEYVDFGDMLKKINWMIIGGESGPGARPFDVSWATGAIVQCWNHGTAAFVKQMGTKPFARTLAELAAWETRYIRIGKKDPGRMYLELDDPKGGKMYEWPEDKRIREYPK